VTLLFGIDSAEFVSPPAGCKVQGGYIGASGATPHVWTPDEWKRASLLKLPIYVPNYFRTGVWTPIADAGDCIARLHGLGVPNGSTVAIDFETEVNSHYVSYLNDALAGALYQMLLYGSSSYVHLNPEPRAGYWKATRPGNPDYSGDGNLFPGSTATQYRDVGPFDVNVFSSDLVFWGGTPVTNWMDHMINALPSVKRGDVGEAVRTLQSLLCARRFATAIDGDFGQDTDVKLRAFQVHFNVPNSVTNGMGDGIAGEHTWASLVTGTAQ
jgi:hypothetical protein